LLSGTTHLAHPADTCPSSHLLTAKTHSVAAPLTLTVPSRLPLHRFETASPLPLCPLRVMPPAPT
jgi:hypothetical protein